MKKDNIGILAIPVAFCVLLAGYVIITEAMSSTVAFVLALSVWITGGWCMTINDGYGFRDSAMAYSFYQSLGIFLFLVGMAFLAFAQDYVDRGM